MEKSQEPNPLDPQTVYVIKNSEIAQTAKSQCRMENHRWRKLSDNEVICDLCSTALIVKNINDLING